MHHVGIAQQLGRVRRVSRGVGGYGHEAEGEQKRERDKTA
jgi:hypothetical protein